MAKTQIKWVPGAFYRLRSEPGVRSMEEKWAAKVAQNANQMSKPGAVYKVSSVQGKKRPQGRWRTTVITATAHAMNDNAKNHTLLKALFATTGTSFTP